MNNTQKQLEEKNTPPEILKAIERHNEKMKLGRCLTDSEIMEYLISTKNNYFLCKTKHF
jgi:hypothetical protein